MAAILVLLGGCAYSFSSGLPSHIKTIAVPLFANETNEFGVAEEITDQLVAEFVRDGTLRVVVDESEASSVLVGTVRVYTESPRTFDRDENVDQYIIQITVEVRFRDRVKDEVLWEATSLHGSALYPNTGPTERAAGLSAAIDQVVQEILSGVVAGW